MRSNEAETNGLCMLMVSSILIVFSCLVFAEDITAFIKTNFTLEFVRWVFKLAILTGTITAFGIAILFFVYAKLKEK